MDVLIWASVSFWTGGVDTPCWSASRCSSYRCCLWAAHPAVDEIHDGRHLCCMGPAADALEFFQTPHGPGALRPLCRPCPRCRECARPARPPDQPQAPLHRDVLLRAQLPDRSVHVGPEPDPSRHSVGKSVCESACIGCRPYPYTAGRKLYR